MVYQITALVLHRQSQQLHAIVPRDGPDDPPVVACLLSFRHSTRFRFDFAQSPQPWFSPFLASLEAAHHGFERFGCTSITGSVKIGK